MFCRKYRSQELFQQMMIGLGFLSVLMLSGCGVEVVDANKPEEKIEAENPEYRIVTGSQPNQYQIRFREDLHVTPVSEPAKISMGAMNVSGGRTYEFEVRQENSTRLLKVAVPKDLEISNLQKAPAKTAHWEIVTNGRIFLRGRAQLYTRDVPLTIEAAEVISDEARITTFNAEDAAPGGQAGRSGGQVRVKAKKITGTLFVKMRGEGGGRGQKGTSLTTPAQEGTSYTPTPLKTNCEAVQKGGAGANGAKGERGFPGQPGGASGDFILDGPQDAVRVEFIPAKGGAGGEGGEGQPGGPGGLSNRMFVTSFNLAPSAGAAGGVAVACPDAPERGPSGLNGPKGEVGEQGPEGSTGKFYRSLNGALVEQRN